MDDILIKLDNIYKIFHNDSIIRSIVTLKGISIALKKGDVICITGSSGSGKTTLLNIIAGKLKPNAGRIEFITKQYTSYVNYKNDIAKVMTYIPQNPKDAIIPNVVVFDYLNNICSIDNEEFQKLTKAEKIEKIKSIFTQLQINNDRLNQNISNLSMGELQRVIFAIALIKDSKIIIFDEPTSYLNTELHQKVGEIINSIAKTKEKVIILTTHSRILSSCFENSIELYDGYFRRFGNNHLDVDNNSVDKIYNHNNRIGIPDNYFDDDNNEINLVKRGDDYFEIRR
ncbi:MAG: ATP-binding cassette domain-containing protein [Candidatus Heimdallarchaeota archaeon]|nr:ATP-binding cassette domain-containing protein [Candidatus Heimdallarchaeota archaeon]